METQNILHRLGEIRAAHVTAIQLIDNFANELRGVQEDLGPIPEESGDPLDYREDREPDGTLSRRGLIVMVKLFRRHLTAEQVTERMSVSLTGTRRRYREYKATGALIYRSPGKNPESITGDE